MPATILYVTAASADDAIAIGRTLVKERLVACANVVPNTTAIYRWKGAMQEEPEAILVLKTRSELVDAATTRIRAIHPYDCPCILAFAANGGNQAFIDWIIGETPYPPMEA